MTWVPTHEQMVASQLSRNDLVQLIAQPDIAGQVMPGFFIRVLIELSTGTEDYRAYTIRRLVQGRQYSGFSNDRAAVTSLYLELNTNTLLDADADAANTSTSNNVNAQHSSSTSFQLNCISNSPITAVEYDLWCQEVKRDPIRAQGIEGFTERKQRAAQLMPGLTGPNIRRQRQQQQSNAAGGGSGGENNVTNNGRSNSPQSGSNLNQTTRVTSDSGAASPASPNPAGNHPPSERSHHSSSRHRGGGDAVGADAAPPSLQVQEQMLASFKRNAVEELRENHTLFTDPRRFATTKLVALRTLENDLGDYIEKVREVVQAKKPTCVVCMTKFPCVVFLPCRHMALCRSCAVDLVSAKCPLCRETIVELWEPEEL